MAEEVSKKKNFRKEFWENTEPNLYEAFVSLRK